MNAYASLNLSFTEDFAIIEPETKDASTRPLCIDRRSGRFSLAKDSFPGVHQRLINGLLGVIEFNSGPHLIVITKADRVARILKGDVFNIRSVDVIPLSKLACTTTQAEDDKRYISFIHDIVKIGNLYYSFGYDLTSSFQAQMERVDGRPLFQVLDDRFNWTRYLQSGLYDLAADPDSVEAGKYILPAIFGFVEVNRVTVNNRSFDYCLISRRSCRRAGTRYFTRGIDIDGNVANFNETEQIVLFDEGGQMAYLQTRGSIPLFWRQIVNLKYTPKLDIDALNASQAAAAAHFREQIWRYGDQIVVNLINHKGYEGRMSDAFETVIKSLNNTHIRYEAFDFHHECAKMKWENINKLIDKLSDELQSQGYTHRSANGTFLKKQNSVVRTNCMDCLDRTNVVQALFARRALHMALVEQGIIDSKTKIEQIANLEQMLRNIWADNADAVSLSYSGTGALKTDFTRTGKRTKQGALQDGVNSCVRYVRNNFLDGARQDAFDLFLGNYRVDRNLQSPFAVKVDPQVTIMPVVLLVSLFMLMASLFFPPPSSTMLRIILMIFWGAIFGYSARAVIARGTDYVTRPLLYNPVHGRAKPMVATY